MCNNTISGDTEDDVDTDTLFDEKTIYWFQ